MPLTEEQIRTLAKIISDHHVAFGVELFGPESVGVEDAELKRLVDAGILDKEAAKLLKGPDALGDTMNWAMLRLHLEDFSRTAEKPEPTDVSAWPYKKIRARIERDPVPMSRDEQRAVDFAKRKAGENMVGLGNKHSADGTMLAYEADAELRRKYLTAVKEETARAIEERKSVRKLRSELGNRTGNWRRDWDRVARTELQNAENDAKAARIADEHGAEAQVARVPNPNACPDCREHYLGKDGKPRIFTLDELQDNGSNVGKKRGDWLPVLGTMHPNCHCRTRWIPKGWKYDDEWDLLPPE